MASIAERSNHYSTVHNIVNLNISLKLYHIVLAAKLELHHITAKFVSQLLNQHEETTAQQSTGVSRLHKWEWDVYKENYHWWWRHGIIAKTLRQKFSINRGWGKLIVSEKIKHIAWVYKWFCVVHHESSQGKIVSWCCYVEKYKKIVRKKGLNCKNTISGFSIMMCSYIYSCWYTTYAKKLGWLFPPCLITFQPCWAQTFSFFSKPKSTFNDTTEKDYLIQLKTTNKILRQFYVQSQKIKVHSYVALRQISLIAIFKKKNKKMDNGPLKHPNR